MIGPSLSLLLLFLVMLGCCIEPCQAGFPNRWASCPRACMLPSPWVCGVRSGGAMTQAAPLPQSQEAPCYACHVQAVQQPMHFAARHWRRLPGQERHRVRFCLQGAAHASRRQVNGSLIRRRAHMEVLSKQVLQQGSMQGGLWSRTLLTRSSALDLCSSSLHEKHALNRIMHVGLGTPTEA